MGEKATWAVFGALVGVFVIIAGVVSIPAVRELLMGFVFIMTSGAIFFLLGVALIVLAVKWVRGRKLKKYLITTGAAAAGFLVSILAHNAIYGLLVHFSGVDFGGGAGVGDEPFFFALAIFVCPVAFLVGTVGSIVLAIKESR